MANTFFSIGCHLESVSRTEPVFENNLALSEKRPTGECRSDSVIFDRVIVLMSVRPVATGGARGGSAPPGKI